MQRVIRRPASRQQAYDRVDDCALIEHMGQGQVLVPERGDPCSSARGGGCQSVAQRCVGLHERATRQMQSHDLHEHLVAVRRSIESARTR